ncbi:MAG: hypothetical protein Q7V63_09915 [Gammaproteobacteria bacterium]|nr:hypothetical protein [Gammaproteobacteria bacterium]
MKIISRLSQVVLASTALMLPIASHAAWADWTHQVYVGLGGGLQYVSNKTRVDNVQNGNTYVNTGFHAQRFEGMQGLSLGLANTMGVNYFAVEFDAIHSAAYNNANFNSDIIVNGTPPETYNTAYTFTSIMPWRYELDGIFGRYVQPNVLAYVKAGATMGRIFTTFQANYDPSITFYPTTINMNKIMYGVVAGAGAQYLVNAHWRVGAEMDVVQFFNGHKTDSNYFYAGSSATHVNGFNGANFQIRQTNIVAKATVSYTF